MWFPFFPFVASALFSTLTNQFLLIYIHLGAAEQVFHSRLLKTTSLMLCFLLLPAVCPCLHRRVIAGSLPSSAWLQQPIPSWPCPFSCCLALPHSTWQHTLFWEVFQLLMGEWLDSEFGLDKLPQIVMLLCRLSKLSGPLEAPNWPGRPRLFLELLALPGPGEAADSMATGSCMRGQCLGCLF